MLKTPLTVLLVLRCLGLLSDGDAGTSEMAESTLLRSSEVLTATSADIVVGGVTWCQRVDETAAIKDDETVLIDEEEKKEAVMRATGGQWKGT